MKNTKSSNTIFKIPNNIYGAVLLKKRYEYTTDDVAIDVEPPEYKYSYKKLVNLVNAYHKNKKDKIIIGIRYIEGLNENIALSNIKRILKLKDIGVDIDICLMMSSEDYQNIPADRVNLDLMPFVIIMAEEYANCDDGNWTTQFYNMRLLPKFKYSDLCQIIK